MAHFEAATYSVFHSCQQASALPELTLPKTDSPAAEYQTADQQQAIKAILKVAKGHRRRPLVLSADRGRGKSAALGMAAAQLLSTGTQRILVTAPSFAAAEAVFKHAASLLPDATSSRSLLQLADAELRFIAPDDLLQSAVQTDLLLIDEAAVIPSPMLADMLRRYSRIVFSTTLHGYEGTGRGFAVRFQHLLEAMTPSWRRYNLVEPIRWDSNDALEAFSFEALLLNADPVEGELVSDAQLQHCEIERLDSKTLLGNEVKLRALFGLMVLAHYRTRPSDLQLLLNNDAITLYVISWHSHIVGTVWLVDEGELNADLSEAIYCGERRLKGHLLPQSLLAHSGLMSAGNLKYQRVLRIAIHPDLRRKGFATALIERVVDAAKANHVDIVGASFSADTQVMSFWHNCHFSSVRLGLQRDDVSGQHAVTLLHACSPKGALLVSKVQTRFEQQWPDMLALPFNHLDVEIVLAIFQQLDQPIRPLSEQDWHDIKRFSQHNATYETCHVAIRQFVILMIRHVAFKQLSERDQRLLVLRTLQLTPSFEVIRTLEFKGKSDYLLALRQAIDTLLVTFLAENNMIIASE
ncbi:UNVERIFIED_CONTAM: hypothetical protein GTU68_008669 [Idotea baltica]|nr:hypothetical protein [Idotea baltica]